MTHIGLKVMMFFLAPGSIESLTRHLLLMKLSLLKELAMNQDVNFFLSEHYKLRLTALNVLEIN